MTRSVIALIIFLAVLTACAPVHEYVIRDNRLHLLLRKPEAKTVQLASSLNSFRLQRAEKLDKSAWRIITSAGVEFSYFYIIDGFMYVPECKFKERDDFGMENCLYIPGM